MKFLIQTKFIALLLIILMSFIFTTSPKTYAAMSVNFGVADGFAVLSGSTVTNTGSSVITGDLGVSPGTAVVGIPPGIVIGTIHAADAVALQAQSDLVTAYNGIVSQACDQNLTGQDLGGLTLTSGTYCFDSSAQLTGTLRLDAQGNSSAVFIFKIGSTLTTASNSRVVMINSGQACNVFWQVGSSATLGTTTNFRGNILALTSITLNTGANVNGRVLARNGAVTLDTNRITNCATLNITPVPTSLLQTPTPTQKLVRTPTPTKKPTPTKTPSPTRKLTPTPSKFDCCPFSCGCRVCKSLNFSYGCTEVR